MPSYTQQPTFLQSIANPFHSFITLPSTTNIPIDKNLLLKLTMNRNKYKLLFDGIILHRNGLELKLSPKSWKLISQYQNLEKKYLLFMYNFGYGSISITSKLSFSDKNSLLPNFLKHHTVLILQQVTSFISILYQYGLIHLSGKFFFKQFLQEAKLKRKLISEVSSIKFHKTKQNTNQIELNSKIIDENQELNDNSSIQLCPIITIDDFSKIKNLPKYLLGGPKNIKHNIDNDKQIVFTNGGFFSIQKKLCALPKKLQTNHSNQNIIQQKISGINSDSIVLQSPENFKLDILVRKTLKQAKQSSKYNHLKITKELLIVEQIKKKEHILTYYQNSLKYNNQEQNDRSSLSTELANDLGSKLETLDASSIIFQQEQNKNLKKTEVYMQCHPHTLKDIIYKKYNSIEELLDTCLQMIESVVNLHSSHVIHRDIKPENALIDFNTNRTKPILKLIDFAQSAIFYQPGKRWEKQTLSKELVFEIFSPQKHNHRLYGATLPYSPPQCTSNRQKRNSIGINNFKIDSWSLGMVLPEIYNGKRFINFPRIYADDIINVIKDSGFQIYNNKKRKKGFDIIQSLITYVGVKNIMYNPQVRIDVKRCYKSFQFLDETYNKWMKRIKNKRLYTKQYGE